MKVLVINCGSSSLKYQLIDMDGEKVLCKGLCERIGMESSMITHEGTITPFPYYNFYYIMWLVFFKARTHKSCTFFF